MSKAFYKTTKYTVFMIKILHKNRVKFQSKNQKLISPSAYDLYYLRRNCLVKNYILNPDYKLIK